MPQRGRPTRIAEPSPDPAFATRQVRCVQASDPRVVGHLTAREIRTMAVAALRDDGDEMAPAIDQRGVDLDPRRARLRGHGMLARERMLAQSVDGDQKDRRERTEAEGSVTGNSRERAAAGAVAHPASAAICASASKA